MHTYRQVDDSVISIAVLKNKKSFLSITTKGYLKQFDKNTQKCIKTFNLHEYGLVKSIIPLPGQPRMIGIRQDLTGIYMILSHNEKYLIMYNEDSSEICISLARNMKLIKTLSFPLEISGKINFIICSYDNRYVFIGPKIGHMVIFDLKKLALTVVKHFPQANKIQSMVIFKSK